jgi:hypothetical protein
LQDNASFLSSDKCPHSTPASILMTPIRAKQVIFSLHSKKVMGTTWTSVQNHSKKSVTLVLAEGKSMHRPPAQPLSPPYQLGALPISCAVSFKIVAPSHVPSSLDLFFLSQQCRAKCTNHQNLCEGLHSRRLEPVHDAQPPLVKIE